MQNILIDLQKIKIILSGKWSIFLVFIERNKTWSYWKIWIAMFISVMLTMRREEFYTSNFMKATDISAYRYTVQEMSILFRLLRNEFLLYSRHELWEHNANKTVTMHDFTYIGQQTFSSSQKQKVRWIVVSWSWKKRDIRIWSNTYRILVKQKG